MRSSFFEFSVAVTGVFTARNAMHVSSHNIMNASTKGYSRQYAEIKALDPLSFNNGRGMVGTGSYMYGVGQHRSHFLDRKYWNEMPVYSEYTTKSMSLGLIQTIFNPSSKAGMSGLFNDFFDSLQDLSTTAGDPTYRVNALKTAESMTKFINNTALDLKRQQDDLNTEIRSVVQAINSLGSQIASINDQIKRFEIDGARANDLRDQRALLIDELSKFVNVSVEETERNPEYAAGKFPDPADRGKSDKLLTISINGYDFIKGDKVSPLEVRQRQYEEKRNVTDVDGLYDIYFMNNGVKFDIYNPHLKGELRGLIDVRDGNDARNTIPGMSTTSYKGVPHYMNKLNELVRVFAMAMNEGKTIRYDSQGNPEIVSITSPHVSGHANGYDANGRNLGNFLFSNGRLNTLSHVPNPDDPYDDPYDELYLWLNAENFQVNPALLDDPKLFASALHPDSDKDENQLVLELINVKHFTGLFREGKLTDYIVGMTSELGIDIRQAESFKNNYNDVTTTIHNQRLAISGVDLNEEMIDVIKFQHMYQAASKLITIIDSIYDNLINRLGV